MRIKALLATGLLAASIGTAFANTTYTVSSTHGTADFNFTDANHFTITLTDLFNPTTQTAQELTGFQFVFTGSALTGGITNVNASGGVVNCTGQTSTSSCPAGVGSSPYNWSLGGAPGSALALVLDQLHPFAIINSTYMTDAQGGGNLLNSQHNPFLVGPVTFTIVTTGLTDIPGVSSSAFLFGTTGTVETASTSTSTSTTSTTSSGRGASGDLPEPSSSALALLGVLLLGGTFMMRKNAQRR